MQPSRESSIIQTSGKWPNGIRPRPVAYPTRWTVAEGHTVRSPPPRRGLSALRLGNRCAMGRHRRCCRSCSRHASQHPRHHDPRLDRDGGEHLARVARTPAEVIQQRGAQVASRIRCRAHRAANDPNSPRHPGCRVRARWSSAVPPRRANRCCSITQAHVLAAESHATFNAKSLRRSRTTPPPVPPACFVSAIESGPLRIRTDTTGDAFQTEIITESVTAEPTSVPLWSLRFNDQLLPPYSTQQVPNQADTLRIGTTVPALRFSVTAVAGDNTIESSWDAEASAAAEWIMQRLSDSVEIEVRAGNLGFVRLHTHQSATPVSRSRLMRGVESQDRSTRSRMAWREAYKLSVDHADEPTDPHWEIRRRRGPSDPTNPLHKV